MLAVDKASIGALSARRSAFDDAGRDSGEIEVRSGDSRFLNVDPSKTGVFHGSAVFGPVAAVPLLGFALDERRR